MEAQTLLPGNALQWQSVRAAKASLAAHTHTHGALGNTSKMITFNNNNFSCMHRYARCATIIISQRIRVIYTRLSPFHCYKRRACSHTRRLKWIFSWKFISGNARCTLRTCEHQFSSTNLRYFCDELTCCVGAVPNDTEEILCNDDILVCRTRR